MSKYRWTLAPLYERQDLNRKCIKLLNEEWPRSNGSREHSQAKSCRMDPPMSLLLLEHTGDSDGEDSGILVGHARICRLPNKENACWIESVIISKDRRGLGLGKMLMILVEDYAKRFGFTQGYLSTEDQTIFYTRCGYTLCDPVVHSTAATSVFPLIGNVELQTKPSPSSVKTAIQIPASQDPPTNTGAQLPPPPPPPPSVLKSKPKPSISTIDHDYMTKEF